MKIMWLRLKFFFLRLECRLVGHYPPPMSKVKQELMKEEYGPVCCDHTCHRCKTRVRAL